MYFQISLITLTILSFANAASLWGPAPIPAYQAPSTNYQYQQPQEAYENYIKRSPSESDGYAAPIPYQASQAYQPSATGYAPSPVSHQQIYQPAITYENYEPSASAPQRVYTRPLSPKVTNHHQIQHPSTAGLRAKCYSSGRCQYYKTLQYV